LEKEGIAMGHSLVKVYVHYVWTTKNRERTLVGDARKKVKDHIAAYAAQNSVEVEALDVQAEHVHALVRLSHDQRIEDVSKLLKGESSHWINQNEVVPGKLSWQTGYAAFSVRPEGVNAIRGYISNQDEHHKRASFAEEFEAMLKMAGYSQEDLRVLLKVGNR